MIYDMAMQNKTNVEITMACSCLCSKDIFQNALRQARSDIRADQSRALRDAAAKSAFWSSEVNLSDHNVFYDAFFANQALVAKRLLVTHVFMDDTSCTNEFGFPIVSVLCRNDSDTAHCIGWCVIKNRTTDSFTMFLTFVSKYFGDIKTFVCDRHYAQ